MMKHQPVMDIDKHRQPLVAVVIVNWNGWRHTIAACRSLDRSTHQALEVIIVDNASTDESLARLRAAVPHAHIIANPVNDGFSGACNIGMRYAVQSGCDYVFLLNNDALVERQTIAALVSASKAKKDSALLGSAVVYISSGEYQFFGSRRCPIIREPEFFTFEKDGALLAQDTIETDSILGAAFFIPAGVLDRVGLFDERFFLNYEETDFCYRARKQGIPSLIVPASLVSHHANASLGSYPAPMQAYFLARNGLLFAEKHGPAEQRRLLFLLKRHYWDMRRAWRATPRKYLPTRAIQRAFWDYAWRRFGDCPTQIRRMDSMYRDLADAPKSLSEILSDALTPAFWKARFRELSQARHLSGAEKADLIGTSMAIGFGTLIFGGLLLDASISFVASVFHEPEFARMHAIGFVMAGGLGVVFASWFFADAVRRQTWY